MDMDTVMDIMMTMVSDVHSRFDSLVSYSVSQS